ncbi:MAG TPA: hypothetical protein VGM95_03520 [Lactobacillaceae bacterium]|jgi:cytoskeletal protein RodZ
MNKGLTIGLSIIGILAIGGGTAAYLVNQDQQPKVAVSSSTTTKKSSQSTTTSSTSSSQSSATSSSASSQSTSSAASSTEVTDSSSSNDSVDQVNGETITPAMIAAAREKLTQAGYQAGAFTDTDIKKMIKQSAAQHVDVDVIAQQWVGQ